MRTRRWTTGLAGVALVGATLVCGRAYAHPANENAPDKRLERLLPDDASVRWQVVERPLPLHHVEAVEAALGQRLAPEERRPTFYVARDDRQRLVGVITVVHAAEADVDIAVALDARGHILDVAVFRGRVAPEQTLALGRFAGLDLAAIRQLDRGPRFVDDDRSLWVDGVDKAVTLFAVALGRPEVRIAALQSR
jgi:hypothetical protein